MLELCFYAEKRSTNVDDLSFQRWRTICAGFGVDRCYIIDWTGFHESFMHKIDAIQCPVTIVGDFDEIPLKLPTVFVEKDTPLNRMAVPFYEYDHPADAMYCFGGDHCGMQQAWHEQETDLSGDWITVPCDSPLWADQAAAIVLAHRKVTHANS